MVKANVMIHENAAKEMTAWRQVVRKPCVEMHACACDCYPE